MLKFNELKSYILNIAILALLSIVYCLEGGIINILSGIFVSVLLGYSVTKYHYLFVIAESLIIFSVITGIYSFSGNIIDVYFSINTAVILILLGLGLGISVNLKLNISKTVIICSFIYLANVLIGFVISGDGFSYKMLFDELKMVVSESLYSQYANAPEVISATEEIVSETINIMYRFIPAFFVCFAGLNGLILTFVFKKVVLKLNKNLRIESFSMFHAEKSLSILFLFTIMISLMINDALFFDALLNVIVILCFMFFICGLSYIDYSMRKKNKNTTYRTLMIIVILPFISITFAVPTLVIVGVGIVDGLFNLRKKYDIKEAGNGFK